MVNEKKGFVLNSIMNNVLKNKKDKKLYIDDSKKYNGLLPRVQLDKLNSAVQSTRFNSNNVENEIIHEKKEYLVRQNLITEANMSYEKKQNENK